MPFGDDQNHADSHVKDLEHLFARNVAAMLNSPEDRRDLPGTGVDHRVASSRQDARQIVDQTATCKSAAPLMRPGGIEAIGADNSDEPGEAPRRAVLPDHPLCGIARGASDPIEPFEPGCLPIGVQSVGRQADQDGPTV